MTDTDERIAWEATSVEATHTLGEELGHCLVGGLAIGIIGPLGGGKTHLVKGIAAGNGTADPRKITSPTFTLIHEYSGRLRFYHVDAYRLRGPSELIALGFDELVTADSVVAVEWADRVRSAMPADMLWIEITAVAETTRRLVFQAAGALAQQCLAVFQTEYR